VNDKCLRNVDLDKKRAVFQRDQGCYICGTLNGSLQLHCELLHEWPPPGEPLHDADSECHEMHTVCANCHDDLSCPKGGRR